MNFNFHLIDNFAFFIDLIPDIAAAKGTAGVEKGRKKVLFKETAFNCE